MAETLAQQIAGAIQSNKSSRWMPFTGQPVRLRWEIPKYEDAFKRGLQLAKSLVPPGTPTLQARQLAEQIRQFDEMMKYRWKALEQERQLASARLAAASAGSAGGGLSPSDVRFAWQYSAGQIMGLAPYYKTPVDFYADVVRHQEQLIGMMGPDEFRQLESWARSQAENWLLTGGGAKKPWGSAWYPGRPSEMRRVLREAGYTKLPPVRVLDPASLGLVPMVKTVTIERR